MSVSFRKTPVSCVFPAGQVVSSQDSNGQLLPFVVVEHLDLHTSGHLLLSGNLFLQRRRLLAKTRRTPGRQQTTASLRFTLRLRCSNGNFQGEKLQEMEIVRSRRLSSAIVRYALTSTFPFFGGVHWVVPIFRAHPMAQNKVQDTCRTLYTLHFVALYRTLHFVPGKL